MTKGVDTRKQEEQRTAIQSAPIYNKCPQFVDKCLNSAAWILPRVHSTWQCSKFPFLQCSGMLPSPQYCEARVRTPILQLGKLEIREITEITDGACPRSRSPPGEGGKARPESGAPSSVPDQGWIHDVIWKEMIPTGHYLAASSL